MMTCNGCILILLAVAALSGFSSQFSVSSVTACPPLQKPVNGNFTGKCNGTATFLDKCTFTCYNGFKLKGNEKLGCNINKQWDNPPPTCVNSCPNVTAPTNGTATGRCNGTIKAGNKCSFSCSEGHVMVGSKEIVCDIFFDWTGKLPKCERSCPILTKVQNQMTSGKCHNGPIKPKDKCTVTCSTGYFLKGEGQLTCNASFQWSSNLPTCEKSCPAVRTPTEGKSFGICDGLIKPGEKCNFTCSQGFLLKGNKEIVCTGKYEWSSQPPKCVKVCPNVKPVANLQVTGKCEGAKGGDKCNISCSDGWMLVGSKEMTCRTDTLEWNSILPVCEKTCPKLEAPGNGTAGDKCGGMARASDKCILTCSQGFLLKGSAVLTCKDDFSWDRPRPTCVNSCQKVDVPWALQKVGKCDGSAKYRDTCAIACAKDYLLKGDSLLTCKQDLEWDKRVPTCVNSCPLVSQLQNGRLEGSCIGSIKSGDKCKFFCDEDYILKGPKELTCTTNLDWDKESPRCEKAKCLGPKSQGMSWDWSKTWRTFCQSLNRQCTEPAGNVPVTQCGPCVLSFKEDPAHIGDLNEPCIALTKCNEVQSGTLTWNRHCRSLHRDCAEPASSSMAANCGKCLNNFIEDSKYKGNLTRPCLAQTGCLKPYDFRRPNVTWTDYCAELEKKKCAAKSEHLLYCTDCLDGYRQGKTSTDPCVNGTPAAVTRFGALVLVPVLATLLLHF